jgi:uncharacterized membrane protein (UPF0136 family)
MNLVGAVCIVYAALIVFSGWLGYAAAASSASVVMGMVTGLLLLAMGLYSRRAVSGGYAAGALTFLLAIYFAYRFIATERFFPSGVLLIVSFMALFLILLGVFIALRHE